MLDFRIFTCLEVCKQMNFTKAAKKLNITQPAVSQHIKWLEKEYKIKLFEMEGKTQDLFWGNPDDRRLHSSPCSG